MSHFVFRFNYLFFLDCEGAASCCKSYDESLKCDEDEGDCDSDNECKIGLKCGRRDCPLAWPPLEPIECCNNENSK